MNDLKIGDILWCKLTWSYVIVTWVEEERFTIFWLDDMTHGVTVHPISDLWEKVNE